MPAISDRSTPTKKGLILSIVVGSILLGIGGVVVLPIGLLALSFRFDSKPDRAMLTLPDGAHAIEHTRVRLPTLCAEYSRNVTYITGGVRGKTTPLELDSCGGYPINCYLIETARGPFLRLDDAVAEHLLDLTTQTTYAVTCVLGEAYIGELKDERACSGWSMMNNDPSTLSVTIGDVEARPITDLTGDATEVYLGRFSGGTGHLRFTPASESPEMAIRHLRDLVQRGMPTLPDAQPGPDQHP
ncbi:MAG TPA: hypothetical protein PKI96_03685 [Sedimentisphaerales bacterium]|jgi:hypothetical protein|nr:hypothetical protein [Sedimentisphaerales bacterium]HQA92155.1 hypothetical protein [Sedimentisphaerales bacterium]HQN32416.1 hypothetical protein [Sedimentisphaerales bacterium]